MIRNTSCVLTISHKFFCFKFRILSSIYLFRSHANLLIENDMKKSEHSHPSNSNPTASWLHNFDTTIATFFQSRIQTTIRPSILIIKVFIAVLKQVGINENKFEAMKG